MSDFYNAKRSKNLYEPKESKPFKLSRSKIELFLDCPKCFYLDRRLGVSRPPGFPFTLNSAVDALLKKEFDAHRAKGEAHPLMKTYGIDAVPFRHENMDRWRENFVGVQFYHKPTNLIIFGAVDDIWQTPDNTLNVVDYKATAVNETFTTLDKPWHEGYKRQMEIYQWLLRKNDHNVSDVGYFVYANGKKDNKAFDGKLEFDVVIIPYAGSDNWVETAVTQAHQCLTQSEIPDSRADCDYCAYRDEANKVINI